MSEISFYKQTQDYRTLNKTLENPLVKQVNIRTDIDIYNPTLYLQDFDIAYNYFVWDNRYYFIQSAYYTARQVWRLQCAIDVLMTYNSQILNSQGVVIQSSMHNDLLNSYVPQYAYTNQIVYDFSINPISNHSNTVYAIIGGN